jgi:hypothetical protein
MARGALGKLNLAFDDHPLAAHGTRNPVPLTAWVGLTNVLDSMDAFMFLVRNAFKIIQLVVSFNPIAVVNLVAWRDGSVRLFPDPAMLVHVRALAALSDCSDISANVAVAA